ncbi:hypothetical protein [Phytoactinopolyspora alkaliphila]|uniref:hypothetical protein n=1 Tax=Phytoactinopolyspora alkaliphila TaxID=1783498 RepID=UPI0013D1CE39|nr:hypothetical protein [Phytoactinopolyspora alkaliphila]
MDLAMRKLRGLNAPVRKGGRIEAIEDARPFPVTPTVVSHARVLGGVVQKFLAVRPHHAPVVAVPRYGGIDYHGKCCVFASEKLVIRSDSQNTMAGCHLHHGRSAAIAFSNGFGPARSWDGVPWLVIDRPARRVPHPGRGDDEHVFARAVPDDRRSIKVHNLELACGIAETNLIELWILSGLGGRHHEKLAESLRAALHHEIHAWIHVAIGCRRSLDVRRRQVVRPRQLEPPAVTIIDSSQWFIAA